jgi:hypothetical protein
MKTMKTSKRKSRWALGLLPVLTAGVLSATVAPAFAHSWTNGDVFAALGNGQYRQYNSAGISTDLLQVGSMVTNPAGGFTAGCAFNPPASLVDIPKLYTTVWHERRIQIVNDGTHTPLAAPVDTSFGGAWIGRPENIVFNTAREYYVGLVNEGDVPIPANEPNLLKFSPTNQLIGSWRLPVGTRGVDAFDLASNQNTIYYTSEDATIRTYVLNTPGTPGTTLGTGTPGTFSSTAGLSRLYGIRLLQGGNPFGGIAPDDPDTPGPDYFAGFMMVADFSFTGSTINYSNIKVLDANGALMNTYDSGSLGTAGTSLDGWFALSVDSGGQHFYASEFYSGNVVRFDALGPVSGFQASSDPFRVSGVCVKGEQTTGVVPFPQVGFFVVGDGGPVAGGANLAGGLPNGRDVYFWGSQWTKAENNTLTAGNTGDAAFKGFAERTVPATPKCGDQFFSKGGQSNPPATLQEVVAVLVTQQITDPPGGEKGSGVVKAIILVRVDPGYANSPGGEGTGEIVGIVCQTP